jgi:quercetin dioxygenase-like cupin family protein
VQFESMPWQAGPAGVRFKVFRKAGKQLRLLEFTADFVEPAWCEKGHVGIVLAGELEVDFQGRVVTYPTGAGIWIPAGNANAHKARAITSTVRLFLVEDVDDSQD